jgi:tRNA nucleotidyltransferase (CCA-adding enzyme)
MSLGYKPSKEMGSCLNELLEIVLEKPELNTKEVLLKIAKVKLL